MREIKFKYIVKRQNGHTFTRVFSLDEIAGGGVFSWCSANIISPDEIVARCQFTGLHDKEKSRFFPNGKEIYEGDMLQSPNTKAKMFQRSVEFQKGMFGFFGMVGDWNPLGIANGNCPNNTHYEVIGSIHESSSKTSE